MALRNPGHTHHVPGGALKERLVSLLFLIYSVFV